MKGPLEFQQRAYQLVLLRLGTREQIIEWLVWNDPNGVYTDSDSEADDMASLTIEEARQIMRDQISR